MKMKELSALTGISDRTIRYYIDDGLFIPEKYTVNYEGRRNYDFSENDAKRLKQIALLRKYGFSISDIKELENGNSKIGGMIQSRIEAAKRSSEEQIEEIKALESVAEKEPDSIDSLCEMLTNPAVEQAPVPNIDEQSAYKPMYDKMKKNAKRSIAVITILFSLIGALYIISVVQKLYLLNGIENLKLSYEIKEQLTYEQAADMYGSHCYSTWDGYFHNTVYEDIFGREYKSDSFEVSDYTPYRIDITIQNDSHATIGGTRLVGEYSKSCVLTFDNYDDAAWMAEEIKPNESKTVKRIIWFNNSLTDEERQKIADNLDFMYELEIDIGFLNSYEPYYFFARTQNR